MCDELDEFDLSIPDFGEWLVAVFEHEVSTNPDEPAWYHSRQFWISVSDSAVLVRHFTRLSREFDRIAQSFSLAQMDQGIWFLLGSTVELGACLADESIDRAERIACIDAMPDVYARFVTSIKGEVPNCFDMWWDMLCDDVWGKALQRIEGPPGEEEVARMNDAIRSTSTVEEFMEAFDPSQRREVDYNELNEDERSILESMLSSLTRILAIDNEVCQACALHGLGHLHHPSVPDVIDAYLAQNPDRFDTEWIQRCRNSTVM
jgi:hypothetical protein